MDPFVIRAATIIDLAENDGCAEATSAQLTRIVDSAAMSAANAFSKFPFFRWPSEDRSPSVPILSEVGTRTHILNKDVVKYTALIGAASSVQTHRKSSVHFLQNDPCL